MGENFPVFTSLNLYGPISTIGANDPFKGPYYDSMTCSEHLIFNHITVNIYLPKSILYLLLVQSSTWKFYVTIICVLSSGEVKYNLTFRLVVILSTSVCYYITSSYLVLSFVISFFITIVELNSLSNNILMFLTFFALTWNHTSM